MEVVLRCPVSEHVNSGGDTQGLVVLCLEYRAKTLLGKAVLNPA